MSRDHQAIEVLMEAVTSLQATNTGNSAVLTEALDNVRGMLAYEDRGWEKINGAADMDGGLTIEDLKAWSLKIRESVVGAPWMKRGFGLRSSYIWQGGIKYTGISKETRGRSAKVQEKIDHPLNQRAFFGSQARKRREGMLYSDGIALWIGDDATKRLEVIPLAEITDTLGHPDHADITYAYRRAWSQRQADGKFKDQVRWYFVDYFKDEASDKISFNGKEEDVDRGKTAFDMHANDVEGWAFGAPDALAAWIWNQIARDLYMDGVKVSQAMATITSKVTGSKGGAQNAALQFALPQSAGSTAVMGAGTELSALSSAGKGYAFSTVREVVSLIASSLAVSNIDLTSNPGDAGSSYGSAATLQTPTRLAMEERRLEHIGLDERVLHWMGAPEAKAYFEPLDDSAEQYRRMQTITLPWLQGTLPEDEYKQLVAAVLGLPAMKPVPQGILLPNNEKSLPRPDVDADGQPTATTSSPTQGRADNEGGSNGGARDLRDDTIG